MYTRITYIRFFSLCIIFSFILTCLIGVIPISLDSCNCENYVEPLNTAKVNDKTNIIINKAAMKKKKLAILVPFRDRFEELLQFAPHISDFITKQNIPHHIFILNQVDKYRFNRASLINVGFLYTRNDFDYVAMHDVDLLPLNSNLSYDYPEKGPFHVAAPDLHPKYHYPTFVGGILIVKREHFELMNGMSNKYWGWGLEDDEFYVRIMDAKLEVKRPMNITTGIEHTFAHIHDREHRKRDTIKCFNQREVTRKRDRETGLNNVDYKIIDKKQLTIDKAQLTVLNISLKCDKNITPWCDCTGGDDTKMKIKNKNKR